MEKILWGTRDGFEEVLSTKEGNFDKVKILATKDGFNSFRVSEYDTSCPDFTKILNI